MMFLVRDFILLASTTLDRVIRAWAHPSSSRKSYQARKRPSTRQAIEVLEDRWLPSTVLPTAQTVAQFVFEGYQSSATGPRTPIAIAPVLNMDNTYFVALSGTDLQPNQATFLLEDFSSSVGSFDQYQSVAFQDIIGQVPQGATLILVGHSLGGMEAQILAPALKNAGYQIKEVETFGSPVTAFQVPGTQYNQFMTTGNGYNDVVTDLSISGFFLYGNLDHPEQTSISVPGAQNPISLHLAYPNAQALGNYDALGNLNLKQNGVSLVLGNVTRYTVPYIGSSTPQNQTPPMTLVPSQTILTPDIPDDSANSVIISLQVNGAIVVDQNWKAGGSEETDFTFSSNAVTEQDRGYSGTNETGTVNYQQSTVTESNGQVSGSISGQGYQTDLSNAAITLSSNTLATVDGSGDTFSGAAGSSVIDDYTAGNSQVVWFDPYSTVSSEYANYTQPNGTGSVTGVLYNMTSGTSEQTLFTGLPTGASEQILYYSAPNDGGTLSVETTDFTADNSTVEFFNPFNTVSTELVNYAGLNGTGSETSAVYNWTAGGSAQTVLAGLPSGVSEQVIYWTGSNLSGSETEKLTDYSAGTSLMQQFSQPPGSTTETDTSYSGPNGTGSTVYQVATTTQANGQVGITVSGSGAVITTPNATVRPVGNSRVVFTLNGPGDDTITGTGLATITIDGDTTADTVDMSNVTVNLGVSAKILGAGSSDTVNAGQNNSVNFTGNGNSFNLGANDSLTVTGTGENVSGVKTDTDTLGNNSQATFSGAAQTINLGANDTVSGSGDQINAGSNTQETINGSSDTINAGSSDTINETGQNDSVNATTSTVNVSGNDSGDTVGGIDDGGTGLGNGSVGSGGVDTGGVDTGGGFFGGYEYAPGYKVTGSNIGAIAQTDQQANQSAAAQAAETAQAEAADIANPGTVGLGSSNSSVFEGSKWNSRVITWSLATSPSTAASPFSSYMGSQYTALVQNAFQQWGTAAGLTFQQVQDSSQADIRIGWGTFHTSTTGVLGYTSGQTQGGQILPGVVIRLEDPAQMSLTGTGNNLTYSGTQATLSQVLLHEIGHGLGLADCGDPKSVMYATASSANTTLDSTDIAGIRLLYAPTVTQNTATLAANTTTLVIYGTGFSPNGAADLITFSNGATGVVTAATPTEITVVFTSALPVGELLASLTVDGLGSGLPVEVASVL